MADSPDIVDQLVARCIELRDSGHPDPVEAACEGHQDQIPAVTERLDRLRALGVLSPPDRPELEAGTGRTAANDTASSFANVKLRDPDSGRDPRSELEARDEIRVLGKYLVGDCIGHGGVGHVARGCDLDLNREVAVKFLREELQARPDIARRFVEEAQIGAQLQHPGIVPVYDLGVSEGRPYFAMKLIKGETLAQLLARRESPTQDQQRLLQVFLQVCQTMAFAHLRGVIHRDLKPDNVMVGRFGEVQVVDWGFAKILDDGPGTAESPPTETAVADVIPDERGSRSIPGSVMGTPCYMPPEQARGDTAAIGTFTDVFALGAILCELLTGEPPYDCDEPDSTERRRRIVRMAADADLADAHARLERSDADPALVALCRDCLAKATDSRPANADLVARRVSEHLARVEARAEQARLRAAVAGQRQRLLAVVVAVVAVALAATLWLWQVADRARADAERQEQQTAVEKDRAEVALRRFQLTRLRVELDEALGDADRLWPAWPQNRAAFVRWLERGRSIAASFDEVRAARDQLGASGVPNPDADLEKLRAHRAEQVDPLRARVRGLVRAAAVRAGSESGEPPELDAATRSLSIPELTSIAWQRVAPADRRVIWGEEPLGLAAAELLVEKAEAAEVDTLETSITVLAWALVSNGRDDEARQQASRAFELSGQQDSHDQRALLEQAIAKASGDTGRRTLRALEAELAAAERRADELRGWQFADPADRFLHRTLQELVGDLEQFGDPEDGALAEIGRRARWCEEIEALTTAHPRARFTWTAAAEAVADPDGEVTSARYASDPPLQLAPQLGLVPIGPNPRTGLWEFYHLRSAWDPRAGTSPAELPIPYHDGDREVPIDESTGVVFVLLPGGSFRMGSPPTEPGRGENEDQHRVGLEPFFIARHELTQAQWVRLGDGENPSRFGEGLLFAGTDAPVTLAHPVENVDWRDAAQLAGGHGLVLPTEAQWEYACRAGTATAWSTGAEAVTLRGFANISDARAREHAPWTADHAGWDDGFMIHAPVGSFAANGFGLFDAHGNVREWCRDWFGDYGQPVREGDGLRTVEVTRSSGRVARGGSFSFAPQHARSAYRATLSPELRVYSLGLRLARPVVR